MSITKKKVGFAAATMFLLAGCASDDNKAPMKKSMEKGQDTGQCHGANACKGKSACATADSACKSMNSCKGKGWVMSSKAGCEKQGGQFKTQ